MKPNTNQVKPGLVRLVSGALIDWNAVLSGYGDLFHVPMTDLWWGIAHEPRYYAQLDRIYTVGEHTLIGDTIAYDLACARGIPPNEVARLFLVHDVHEGLGWRDVAAPLKAMPFMVEYVAAELVAKAAVAERTGARGLPSQIDLVDEVDLAVRDLEQHIFWGEPLKDASLAPYSKLIPEKMPDPREVFAELSARWQSIPAAGRREAVPCAS